MSENSCETCQFAFCDDRCTDYRRDPMWFCRRKGPFFSRNYRVGEKTRIDPKSPACDDYVPSKEGKAGKKVHRTFRNNG